MKKKLEELQIIIMEEQEKARSKESWDALEEVAKKLSEILVLVEISEN